MPDATTRFERSERKARGESPIATEVRDGLRRREKRLPAWLFYDDAGSRLYEEITRLPEYYPTRAERSIFLEHADAIVTHVRGAEGATVRIAELGAGTATKSQIIARAFARAQGSVTYLATDVSPAPLEEARARFAREEPGVDLRVLAGRHGAALEAVRALPARRLVLFIGSSIGNYEDEEARVFVRAVRASVDAGDALLLGTDLRKSLDVLLPAYDDARGVTAAFK